MPDRDDTTCASVMHGYKASWTTTRRCWHGVGNFYKALWAFTRQSFGTTCGVGKALVLFARQRGTGVCLSKTSSRLVAHNPCLGLGVCQTPHTPLIYTFCAKAKMTGTDIIFLTNHTFRKTHLASLDCHETLHQLFTNVKYN